MPFWEITNSIEFNDKYRAGSGNSLINFGGEIIFSLKMFSAVILTDGTFVTNLLVIQM